MSDAELRDIAAEMAEKIDQDIRKGPVTSKDMKKYLLEKLRQVRDDERAQWESNE